MKTIVAIGGGELKDLETLPIDRAIVRFAKKKHPKVLFIPTASNDALGYWETFREIYGKKLGCKTDVLFLIREKPSRKVMREKILSADIIYVGGGNTLRMLRIWRKLGVDVLLKKAYDKNIILSGLSAGAICWFRHGVSDSRRFMKSGQTEYSLMRVSALGFLPFMVSPHHVREKKLRDSGIREIMKRTSGIGLALDDNTALVVQNDGYEVLKSKEGVDIEKVFQKNGKIEKKSLKESGTLKDLQSKG